MFLTVGICTWNRSKLLHQTLSSLEDLMIPDKVRWEVLVVNNNCTDDTDEVIALHEGRIPLRRVFEPTPGKSHALNLAVREARGDYILWTDDDVLVEPGWLQGYAEAFERWPDASIFGGPIRPWFPNTPPAWLKKVLPSVATAYAVRDFGEEELLLSKKAVPFGANMAVRMREQREYLYDTRLGPRPGSALRGEESHMVRKMLENGAEGRWVPGAVVRHYIPENRQTMKYLASYYKGAGEVLALLRQAEYADSVRFFGRPLELYGKALSEEIKYRIRRVTSKPEKWVHNMKRAHVAWGLLWASAHVTPPNVAQPEDGLESR